MATRGVWPRLSRRGLFFGALAAVGGFVVGRLRIFPSSLVSGQNVGRVYHQWSKPGYAGLLSQALDWGAAPAPYKTYPQAETIPLPTDFSPGGLGLEEAIARRRSIRNYSGQAMSLAELSSLLHHASGVTLEGGYPLRAAPSAGALYPIEIYPVAHDVEGLEAGIYHYAVREHALELLKEGDFRQEIVKHALGQRMTGRANVVFLLTAIFQRTEWKYGARAYRYVMLEAGHIGENIYLTATALALGPCAVGAFSDDDLNRLLEIDGEEESVIYMLTVGKV